MGELERVLDLQQVGARERRRGVRCEVALEPGQGGRVRSSAWPPSTATAPRGGRLGRQPRERSDHRRVTGSGPISCTRGAFAAALRLSP